jgi:hypothetical protein
VIVDLHLDERLGAREACDPGKPPEAAVPEPPVDELVARVDLTGRRDADRGFVSIWLADAVRLDQDGAAAAVRPRSTRSSPSGFSTRWRMPKQ